MAVKMVIIKVLWLSCVNVWSDISAILSEFSRTSGCQVGVTDNVVGVVSVTLRHNAMQCYTYTQATQRQVGID